jgi:dipeptidyl aminopeptidase/acylaminoacyl peptidase
MTGNKLGLLVQPLEGDGKPYLMDTGDSWTIRRTLWVGNHEILVGFFRPISFGLDPVLVTRAMLLDMRTRKVRTLFRREKGFGFLQLQDKFLGRIVDNPGSFLIEGTKGNNPKLPSVYAVSGTPSKLPTRAVQNSLKDVVSWEADHLSNVRVGHGFTSDQKQGVLKLKDAQGNWHDVSGLLDREASVLALPTRNLNRYLILMSPLSGLDQVVDEDAGLRHVYEYDVSNGSETLVYAANHSEVASIVLNWDGREVVMVRYQDEALQPLIFDPQLKEVYAALNIQFSDAWIGLTSVSDDLSRVLLTVESPKVPGALYLYDANNRELTGVSVKYPSLDSNELAQVYSVSYASRDGLTIPAYVTLPAKMTLQDARNLPFVVLPHGGPHARDFRRFDWMAQMLANAGYGVLQMNFRGSSGYGAGFERAGRNRWASAIINDITDGARWLTEQGLADPQRLCVVGVSFGGYAANMSLVKEPNLYRCGVSLNGVSDLESLVKKNRRYIGGAYSSRHIGGLTEDALREGSPLNGVSAIKAPMLQVASEHDRVVYPAQTRRMVRALQSQSKEVEVIELPKGDHYLSRQDNRQTFAEALLAFLGRYIGEQDLAERTDLDDGTFP